MLMLLVTDDVIGLQLSPAIIDCHMLTGTSFPSESVQTLFFEMSTGHAPQLDKMCVLDNYPKYGVKGKIPILLWP